MTGDRDTSARPRTVAAVLLCLVVLAVGAALAATSDPSSLDLAVALPVTLLPLVLVAAYVFTGRVTLDFEVRGNAHSVALGQLPLALGALLVAPLLHLAACLAATVALIALRRQYNLKGLYNLAVASFEVGAAAFAVSMVASSHDVVTRSLWLALLVGLLASDLVGPLLLGVVWWLLDMPQPWSQVLQPIVLGMTTSAAATALTVVAVSAAATEPAAVPLILVFAGGLAHAYRKYRRLRVQQATTQDLYAFVRDLGPLESDEDAALDVVEQVRLLLHAERLELLTTRNDGQWENLVAAESSAAARVPGEAPVAGRLRPEGSQRAGTATLACMTTPLFGSDGLLGLLTVKGRLGDVRSFDLGDFQLLEALGGELATALERGRLLAHLRRTATTDSLTGLPNLPEMSRLLDLQIAGAPELVVLAAVSVDSFREVNDTLGHAVGDALLLETAERLRRTHPAALIARIGGGRFAVAMPSVEGELSAHLFGLGIRALVEGEARIGAVGTHIRLSVGVAQFPDQGSDANTLLRRAETAMTSAREAHGGPVAWAPAYEVDGQRRLAVVTALREAIATGAVGVAFQPKIDLRTGVVSGVEALARWTHPALGHVRPDEFIPLAETSGFIGMLTSTVLRQAATTCRGWQRRAPGVGVSVNVSSETVLDAAFVTEVSATLGSVGLAPDLLTLELTEGVVVRDPALAVERLGELRALGVRISVDDFGTGYSSLTYLKGLPVDEVKIDKGFVKGLGTDEADRAVVRAVVDIAHTLGLTVVAEGVEETSQEDVLRSLGVDEVQGYLHARPMPAQAMAGWLRTASAATPR